MLCIACCDDDAFWRQQFTQRLEKLLQGRGISFCILSYGTGQALLDALKDPGITINLLFLDIMLGSEDGLDLARQLRALRPGLPVVLVSSSSEFALSGYAVHPAHYLLKPVSDKDLAEALDYCLALEHGTDSLVIRWKKAEKVLPISEILYVEVLDSMLKVHTRSGGEYQTSGHLSMIERRLPAGRFLRCHKSYLVNLDWVEGIRRYSLLLDGDHTIPVSKQNYAAVKEAYLRYASRRLS